MFVTGTTATVLITARSIRSTTNRNHKHIREVEYKQATNDSSILSKALYLVGTAFGATINPALAIPMGIGLQKIGEVAESGYKQISIPVRHTNGFPSNPTIHNESNVPIDTGRILYYRIVGDLAKVKEIDFNLLENSDNFMWTQFSNKLSTKLPIANLNDKYIDGVLSDLSLSRS